MNHLLDGNSLYYWKGLIAGTVIGLVVGCVVAVVMH